MHLSRILVLLLLIGQTPPAAEPIHTVYDSSRKWTEIKTNWLYVVNDSNQFLQLKLIAHFNGKQMPKTGPTTLQIEIISHAPKTKYAALPKLVATADGNDRVIGNMAAHPNLGLLGRFKEGKEDSKSMVNQVSSVPPNAAILTNHKVPDLAAEWIVTDISWNDLSALSRASKVDWKLDDTQFSFNDTQLIRLKQFVAAVTPASGVVVVENRNSEQLINDKPTHLGTPSDGNKTDLRETLDWLKTQISKYGADYSVTGRPQTLTMTRGDGCRIEFRLLDDDAPELPGMKPNPANFDGMPTLLFTTVNLKDLDPESVELRKFEGRFWLSFATHNREQLIGLDYKLVQGGGLLEGNPRLADSASISLKKNDYGPEIREAMRHAIRLCQ